MNDSCRQAFSETLLACAFEHPEIVVVTSDSRGSALLTSVAEAIGNRFIEVGIAEQNAVGIAAGLAKCGKTVFVCGPACFYCARSLEQVKNDVAYSRANVIVVGVSGGVAYGSLGSTHHSLHDIAVFRAIPGISVILPSDARQTAAVVRHLVDHPGPAYIRFGRAAVADVYEQDAADSAVYRYATGATLRDGADITLIACGQMVHPAIEAARLLEALDIDARVVDMPTVDPIDGELVVDAAMRTGAIVTIEEHSVRGGLGGAVAEVCAEHCPVPMKILGIPDEPAYIGEQSQIFEYYRLTAAGIRDAAVTIHKRRIGSAKD